MSKTIELAQHLEKLHINNMYKSDFYWTWDKTDEELDAIFTVADALRDLRERNKSTRIFDSGLGISISVSYTHLDVYKRQIISCSTTTALPTRRKSSSSCALAPRR